ncbi:PREDICTED: phosphatidylinositol 4,5-bisphosphate 5-phosphatase A-like [Chinchilla lanigera]|uniref:phosphatidylinositol 4,5-bisphosphate 5-phosphatase A-like n=1 Tax=Chinchilla lanigera TaxID=34839 RepID=UPI0006970DCA|nr:PREDICTED: phosphatidylinositol 4,5-bisphosphate 5-phosphatase A-like [Chinchilla lanigera]
MASQGAGRVGNQKGERDVSDFWASEPPSCTPRSGALSRKGAVITPEAPPPPPWLGSTGPAPGSHPGAARGLDRACTHWTPGRVFRPTRPPRDSALLPGRARERLPVFTFQHGLRALARPQQVALRVQPWTLGHGGHSLAHPLGSEDTAPAPAATITRHTAPPLLPRLTMAPKTCWRPVTPEVLLPLLPARLTQPAGSPTHRQRVSQELHPPEPGRLCGSPAVQPAFQRWSRSFVRKQSKPSARCAFLGLRDTQRVVAVLRVGQQVAVLVQGPRPQLGRDADGAATNSARGDGARRTEGQILRALSAHPEVLAGLGERTARGALGLQDGPTADRQQSSPARAQRRAAGSDSAPGRETPARAHGTGRSRVGPRSLSLRAGQHPFQTERLSAAVSEPRGRRPLAGAAGLISRGNPDFYGDARATVAESLTPPALLGDRAPPLLVAGSQRPERSLSSSPRKEEERRGGRGWRPPRTARAPRSTARNSLSPSCWNAQPRRLHHSGPNVFVITRDHSPAPPPAPPGEARDPSAPRGGRPPPLLAVATGPGAPQSLAHARAPPRVPQRHRGAASGPGSHRAQRRPVITRAGLAPCAPGRHPRTHCQEEGKHLCLHPQRSLVFGPVSMNTTPPPKETSKM